MAHKCVTPGLPEQQFDSIDSDEEVADPVEDEHHVIFDCFVYTYARKQFADLSNISLVLKGHFHNQPDCNRVAEFFSQVKTKRMNLAQSDGLLPGPEQTCKLSSSHHMACSIQGKGQ